MGADARCRGEAVIDRFKVREDLKQRLAESFETALKLGDGMAQVYANEFSEQELKDLVTFYKSTLGQKLLASEPRAIQFSMSYMNQWAQQFAETINGQFRAEMKKRGKDI